MTLHVRITREKQTRHLAAHVIQHGADGAVAGSNLLQGHAITRIETAKAHVQKTLPRWPWRALEFEVAASPDLEESYRPGDDRRAVRREVQS